MPHWRCATLCLPLPKGWLEAHTFYTPLWLPAWASLQYTAPAVGALLQDMLKFGNSSREYVLLRDDSKGG